MSVSTDPRDYADILNRVDCYQHFQSGRNPFFGHGCGLPWLAREGYVRNLASYNPNDEGDHLSIAFNLGRIKYFDDHAGPTQS